MYARSTWLDSNVVAFSSRRANSRLWCHVESDALSQTSYVRSMVVGKKRIRIELAMNFLNFLAEN